MDLDCDVVTPLIQPHLLSASPDGDVLPPTQHHHKLFFFRVLFRCEKNLDFANVVLSFVCDKYYLIMDGLGSKDSSCDLQLICAISYLFLSIFNVSCMSCKI